MAELECRWCKSDFNSASFGAGKAYCSAKCRIQAKNDGTTAGVRGRPRKFPVATQDHVVLILADLEKLGWRISQRNPDKNRFFGTKNTMQMARFCFGGGQKDEKWAHICAFVRNNVIYYHSTCVRGSKGILRKMEKENVERIPCGNCNKCNMYNWFCTIERLYQKAGKEKSPLELAFEKDAIEKAEMDKSRERLLKMEAMSEPQRKAYAKNQPEKQSEWAIDETALG